MTELPAGYTLHKSLGLASLPAQKFHDIAQLRQRVFVLEQNCVYLDLDGRDLEPDTHQYWVEASGGAVAATLRVLNDEAREPGLHAIGRVVTSPEHRGKALAAALMTAAVEDYGERPLILEAQSHLTHWYARFGFAASGPEYLEDGIPHTSMRRASNAGHTA